MTEKRYALQKKANKRNGDGLDFPSFIQFTAGTIPTVYDKFHGTLQEASLFLEKQLENVRHGKTTRELIEEQLPDYELVEVKIAFETPQLSVDYGSFLADDIETQLNQQGYTLGSHKGMVNKLNEALKVLYFSFTSLTPEMEGIAKELEKKVLAHATPLSPANLDEHPIPEPGDLICATDEKTKEKTYSTVSRVIQEDGKVKVFDEGGYNYLEDITLVCKAANRLDTTVKNESAEAGTATDSLPWVK